MRNLNKQRQNIQCGFQSRSGHGIEYIFELLSTIGGNTISSKYLLFSISTYSLYLKNHAFIACIS